MIAAPDAAGFIFQPFNGICTQQIVRRHVDRKKSLGDKAATLQSISNECEPHYKPRTVCNYYDFCELTFPLGAIVLQRNHVEPVAPFQGSFPINEKY